MHSRKEQKEQEKPGPRIVPNEADEVDSDSSAAPATEVAATEQTQKLITDKQDLTNTLVRLQADFDNYRKRIEKERGQERQRGIEVVVEQLLPVLDGFDRALAADDDPGYAEYHKGFELIRKQLWDVLSKQGVQRIESAGKEFDPNVHHAIEQVATNDYPEGTVIGEMQPGYTYQNRVLRPAMVRVAAGRKN